MSVFLSALSVIGIVLKWILLILLGIVGFILFLVILICSHPVFYKLTGEKTEEKLGFHAKVTYLFSLIRIFVNFEEGKLKYSVKLAWKELASSEKEVSPSPEEKQELLRHGELEVEPLKKAELPQKTVPAEKPAPENSVQEVKEPENGENSQVPCEGAEEESAGPEQAETATSTPRISVFERESMLQKGLRILRMKPEEVLESWQTRREEKTAAKEEKRLKKEALRLEKEEKRAALLEEKVRKRTQKEQTGKNKAAKAEKPKKPLSERIDEGVDRLLEWLDAALDIVDTILDAPDRAEEIFDEKVEPKLKQFRKYKRLYDVYPRKKETLMVFVDLIVHVLRPLIPKRCEAALHFGSGDPYTTARILGGYYSIAPMILTKQTKRQHLEVSADMMEKVLLFDLDTRGHFSVNTVVIFPLLRAIFNRDTFRLIRFALKLRKQLNKQKEKEQAVKAASPAGSDEE